MIQKQHEGKTARMNAHHSVRTRSVRPLMVSAANKAMLLHLLVFTSLLLGCRERRADHPATDAEIEGFVQYWVEVWPSVTRSLREVKPDTTAKLVFSDVGFGINFGGPQTIKSIAASKYVAIELKPFSLEIYPPVAVSASDLLTQQNVWHEACKVPDIIKSGEYLKIDRDTFSTMLARRVALFPPHAEVIGDRLVEPSVICVLNKRRIEGVWWPRGSNRCVHFSGEEKTQGGVDELVRILSKSLLPSAHDKDK